MTPGEVGRALPLDNYTFIVTTGTGAYADTGYGSVDEVHPFADNQRGRWQASMESSVLEIRKGRTIVIRPTWAYGPDRTTPRLLNRMVDRAAEHGVSYLPELADYEVSTVHVKRPAEAVAVAAGVAGRVEEIPRESDIERFGGLGIFSGNMIISQR